MVVALDPECGAVWCAEAPAFSFEERRRIAIKRNHSYHVRIVNRLEHIEIYVNDVLCLAFSRYCGIGGEVGLFIDRGEAMFRNVRLRELNVTQPQ